MKTPSHSGLLSHIFKWFIQLPGASTWKGPTQELQTDFTNLERQLTNLGNELASVQAHLFSRALVAKQWKDYRRRKRWAFFCYAVFPCLWLPISSAGLFHVFALHSKEFFWIVQVLPWTVLTFTCAYWWFFWPCRQSSAP